MLTIGPFPTGQSETPSGLLVAPMALVPISLELVASRLGFVRAVSGGNPHRRTPRTINAMISLMAAGLMVAQINQHRFPAPAVLPGPYSTSLQDELPITPAKSASRCGTGVAASPCRQLAGMLQPDRFVEQHVAGGPHADTVDHAVCSSG